MNKIFEAAMLSGRLLFVAMLEIVDIPYLSRISNVVEYSI
jgi:hypothetical protein